MVRTICVNLMEGMVYIWKNLILFLFMLVYIFCITCVLHFRWPLMEGRRFLRSKFGRRLMRRRALLRARSHTTARPPNPRG
jgi:hypothetical protein